jgi:prolyl-tRNA editing enzyme YbaK/EbsC (Cys-tRNA(Pro) deacylase)
MGAVSESSSSSSSSSSLWERISAAQLRMRILELERRLSCVENALNINNDILTDAGPVRRVTDHLRREGVAFCMRRVPTDYYAQTLEWRAKALGASSVDQLCKTIVLENRSCARAGCSDVSDSRFYAVVVQYGAKIDVDKLRDVLHRLRPPGERIPKKRFALHLAPEDVSAQLTGFTHNSVSPFGLASRIPVIVCSRIAASSLKPPFVYLGGGEVDLKIGLSVSSLVQALMPIVGEVSIPRLAEDDDEL